MTHRFISTAIPYVNARPHIGFALELLLADVIARQARSAGESVFLVTGTDDNSLKNALAAERAGLTTEDFVAANSEMFRDLANTLDISHDDFIQTSVDARHRAAVIRVWRACEANGDIYSADYTGLYCVGCEQFYDPVDLHQGLCPEHQVAPEKISERNYFFRLSRYQVFLKEQIQNDALKINPTSRKNEVLAFLERPLKDLSISRSRERARGWGIPVPGDASQVVYVWFDALVNYISVLGFAKEPLPAVFDSFWSGADQIQHVIGKGVLRFHAVYWPAILQSAGLRIPTELLVHGYVTVNNEKISKSLGNVISPLDVYERHGLDALRYYLLRHVGSIHDGDFSEARFDEVYASELANQLGNLLNRVCTLGVRHHITQSIPSDLGIGLVESVRQDIFASRPHTALAKIWRSVDQANAFISQKKPWQLARQNDTKTLTDVLGQLYFGLGEIGKALAPLLPDTSRKIELALCATESPPDRPHLFPKT